jgi:hypothetical protein
MIDVSIQNKQKEIEYLKAKQEIEQKQEKANNELNEKLEHFEKEERSTNPDLAKHF